MVLPGSNMFRRGTSTREGDVEEQRDGVSEMTEGSQRPSTTRRISLRLPRRRTGSNSTSGGGRETPRANADGIQPGEVESPKSPNFNINLTNMPSTRLHLPNLARTWTRGSSGPPTRPPSPQEVEQRGGVGGGDEPRPSMQSQWSRSSMQQQPVQPGRLPAIDEPQPAHTRPSEDRMTFMQRFRGADPAEMHLADMADRGRQRIRRRDRSDGSALGRDSDPPKRFLFCFPWVKSRRIRNSILRCFVSGLLLLLTLSVCKL